MGDNIIIEKIELIYDGTLFQIDYYNENKNYHGRMFINPKKLFSMYCPNCGAKMDGEESER